MAYGVTMSNINVNSLGSALVNVTNSSGFTLDKLNSYYYGVSSTGRYALSVLDTDVVTLSNSFIIAATNSGGTTLLYMDTVRNLSLIQNSLLTSSDNDSTTGLYNVRVVKELVGNVVTSQNNAFSIGFASTINGGTTYSVGYTASVATDLLSESYNVFESPGPWNVNVYFGKLNMGSDISIRNNGGGGNITPATYQSTYGLGTGDIFGNNTSVILQSRIDPVTSQSTLPVYLSNASDGSQIIPSQLDPLAYSDAGGYIRVYPADAGAYDLGSTTHT